MFELADIERDPEERRRPADLLVAGGGFLGDGNRGAGRLVRLLTSRDYHGQAEECRCRDRIGH
jgi:hypothetical protein